MLSITDNPQCEELNDKNDSVNWNHRISALKLAKECNESLFKLTIEGPNVRYMKMLEDKLSHMESIRIRQEQEQQHQQLFATNTAVEYDPAKDRNRVI